MEPEVKELLERGIAALESLAQDPVIEMETAPPNCPFCERINPTVRVSETEATGSLGEFVIRSQCLHCDNVFYAIPIQWSCVSSTEQARHVISERAEVSGFNSREN